MNFKSSKTRAMRIITVKKREMTIVPNKLGFQLLIIDNISSVMLIIQFQPYTVIDSANGIMLYSIG